MATKKLSRTTIRPGTVIRGLKGDEPFSWWIGNSDRNFCHIVDGKLKNGRGLGKYLGAYN